MSIKIFNQIKRLIKRSGGDASLWVILILLLIISIPVGYTSIVSLAYQEAGGDTTNYLIGKLVYAFGGIAVAWSVHHIDYRFYQKYWHVIFFIALLLMCGTLLFARPINGEKRWLHIFGISVQTSEILKIALVITMARMLVSRQNIIDKVNILPSFSYANWQKFPKQNHKIFRFITIPILLPVAISASLVMVNNLSMALMMVISCFVMLVFGRVKSSELWRLACVTFSFVTIFVLFSWATGIFRGETWVNRISRTFTRMAMVEEYEKDETLSDADFQIEQSRIAIASGWKFGKGAGKSSQRAVLPYAYSDYVYAIIVEEYGIIGGVVVLLLFLLVFYRTIVIFRRCEDRFFAGMLVLGLGVLITIQALIHILVATDTFFPTGQSLPIISKGGTSMVITATMFGMILGVSRLVESDIKKKKLEEQFRKSEEEWLQQVLEKKGEVVTNLDGVDIDQDEVIWKDDE